MTDAIADFEDILSLFETYKIRYLIIGGLAVIYHAKPRFTKDMDIWIEFTDDNIRKANLALSEFGSPENLSFSDDSEVLQLGFAPNRIDFFLRIENINFIDAWTSRIKGSYGKAPANWIDIDTLIKIKSGIQKPKHQEDARILIAAKEFNKKK
ncbi:MAG: hypothetical protein JXR91_05800 [Deltaproteobacteria bacterium]|nr:hypothetical protein [Deltaproteobacteria bacterium]